MFPEDNDRTQERLLDAERQALQEARKASIRFWATVVVKLSITAVIAATIVVAGWRFIHLPVFNITQLELNGDTNKVPMSVMTAAVEEVLDGNYFTADIDAVRLAAERIPWVKKATVKRVWPNKLKVSISVYKVLAIYEDGRLVSTEGDLFTANPDESDDSASIPNFFGPAVQVPTITRYYHEFASILSSIDTHITEIWFSDRGSWTLVMEGPEVPATKIELGHERTAGSVVEKLKSLAACYSQVVALMSGPPSSIDMRYNNAFAAGVPDRKAMNKLKEDRLRAQRSEGLDDGEESNAG